MICDPINAVMSAPTADGGAAAILCSLEFLEKNPHLVAQAVEIVAQHMTTDTVETLDKGSYADVCGVSMATRAAQLVFEEAAGLGVTESDVGVLEVHDCFSPAELMMYEALGLCKPGKAVQLINSLQWIKNDSGVEYGLLGGKWIVNPSGGLESKGHPIGATGIAQVP